MSDMEQPGESLDSGAAESTAVEDRDLNTAEQDDDQQSETDEDSQEQTEAEEFGEIEVDGKKFELPKSVAEKLKSERMMHAAFTQKTQALAEERRQFESQSAEQQKTQQEYVQDYAKVVSIQEQLAELNAINLGEYVDSDPVGVQRIMLQKQDLESKLNQASQAVTQKQQQFALKEQQEFAKHLQEASAYVAREIPGWSNGRDTELQQFTDKHGIPKEALGHLVVRHPALLKIIHQAELYSRQEKKVAAKPAAPVQEKPVTRVSGSRAPVQRDPNKMSTDEWMANRNSQLRKSR